MNSRTSWHCVLPVTRFFMRTLSPGSRSTNGKAILLRITSSKPSESTTKRRREATNAEVEDEGAPVFTSDARFIGIITPTLLVDGENATRHVITSLIPLNKVIPENTGDSQGN